MNKEQYASLQESGVTPLRLTPSTSWVYWKTHHDAEHPLWTVGFYKPDGTWEPESDHPNQEDAAKRTAWLNGSRP